MIWQIFYFYNIPYVSTFQSYCTDTAQNCSVEAGEGCWMIEKL